MFDLETSIAAWRRSFRYSRVVLPDDLDELEQHVRDQVAALVAEGWSEEAAFEHTMREMGDYGSMEAAYREVYWGKLRRKRALLHGITTELTMLKNYVKIALRSLLKRKGYALINVFGLAVGLAASLLIMQYVAHELSYDDFHEHAEQIYRVRFDIFRGEERLFKSATTYPGVGPAMEADFPEVESFARLYLWYGGRVVRYEEQRFQEDLLFSADSTFLTMFSYPMLRGDARTALVEPNTAVVSEETAHKYFGDDDPVGKRIRVANDQEYEITGVAASPENSHLKFSFLLSFSTLPQIYDDNELDEWAWAWYDFYTYVKLRPDADPAALEARLPGFIARHKNEAAQAREAFTLQHLPDIHLHSDLIQEARVNGSATSVYFLALIAAFILLIAWINYINLSTARAMERAKEIGVRKVVGAHRNQLIRQFLLESLCLNALAAGLALGLVWLALPLFNTLVGKDLSFTLTTDAWLWGGLGLFFVVGAFLSGLYPAFVLSSYRPVTVLKGALVRTREGLRLRKALVVGQFVASVGLIAGTLVVYQQLDYMHSQDLGIDVEQTLVLDGPGVVLDDSLHALQVESFKQELRQQPRVRSVAASTEIPGNLIYWTNDASTLRDDPEASFTMYQVGIDDAFLDSYGHRVLAGRGFDRTRGTETDNVVLNEAAAASLGWQDPTAAIGERIRIGSDTLAVAGVVANFHQEGLQKEFYPIAFRWQPEADTYFSIKVQPDDLPATLARVERQFATFFPENPFSYVFLDDHFDNQYQTYQRFGKAFGVFALLAIVVACLGLFGLSSFAAAQRTKEIGIRKVLGSTAPSIVLLLSKDFLKLVLIASMLAVPLVWFLMEQWLQGFAFRIDISWWIFLVASVTALGIALLTVSYQSLKAALTDPAKALRYE